jgi:hypothetical protein
MPREFVQHRRQHVFMPMPPTNEVAAIATMT